MARPLSIGITAPYSGKGGFQTLERIVHHYDHIHTSLDQLDAINESGEPL
jgi:cytochrome c peroxidase